MNQFKGNELNFELGELEIKVIVLILEWSRLGVSVFINEVWVRGKDIIVKFNLRWVRGKGMIVKL